MTTSATNIHNRSLQFFNQDYDLAYHTTYAVLVNFIPERQDLQSKSTRNKKFLRIFFFGQFYLLSESFCQESAERKSPKKYFPTFVMMSDP